MSETDTSNARAVAFERWANMFTAHKAFSHPSVSYTHLTLPTICSV